ncbi:unnamed protein product [Brugia pahangi]|uniref:Rubis-subs-bind domain-containing protein n=1 Tax=Brugia pahangi TaxID=6280 RepID=A0A0N4TVG2_BRUPA|nr:unnamed protein product [Brugia pahangi]
MLQQLKYSRNVIDSDALTYWNIPFLSITFLKYQLIRQLKRIYSEAILPKHDAMKLIYNCEQSLSRRRLLVYEKLRMVKNDEKTYVEKDCYENMTFRQRVIGYLLLILQSEDKDDMNL